MWWWYPPTLVYHLTGYYEVGVTVYCCEVVVVWAIGLTVRAGIITRFIVAVNVMASNEWWYDFEFRVRIEIGPNGLVRDFPCL